MFQIGDMVTTIDDEPWHHDGDKYVSDSDPIFGVVYTVRRTKDDVGEEYVALEEIPFTEEQDDPNDDYWWDASEFRRAKQVLDFSDIMSPKIKWVPE